jgi:hypothetical protein
MKKPALMTTMAADDCPDVELIFARGTGELPGAGRVGQALADALGPQLGGRSLGAAAVSMLAGVPPVGDRIGSIGSAPPLPPDAAGQVAAVAVFGNHLPAPRAVADLEPGGRGRRSTPSCRCLPTCCWLAR